MTVMYYGVSIREEDPITKNNYWWMDPLTLYTLAIVIVVNVVAAVFAAYMILDVHITFGDSSNACHTWCDLNTSVAYQMSTPVSMNTIRTTHKKNRNTT